MLIGYFKQTLKMYVLSYNLLLSMVHATKCAIPRWEYFKKKKIVFSMGEKWLTKVAQHDLMEEKINGACKA